LASRRDKLQCYLDTLVALTADGPIRVSMLSLKTRINCSPLKAILVDLERKKLVEKRLIAGNFVYGVTPKARTVLSHFGELAEFFPDIQLFCRRRAW
jgi:predicted transcriptional regulator